ncbi:MAG: hypothetical protein ACR2OJ_03300 [Hyphomicrobiales bacterium]
MPTTQAFHTHYMIAWQNKLLAVTSAWRAGLQVSTDKGRNWENVYDHPTPAERLSRFHEPTVLADTLYGSLKDPFGIRMVRFTDDDEFEPVPGWPENRTFFSLTVHKDLIYAIVLVEGNRCEIWRTDGTTSQLVSDRLGQSLLMGMTSDGKRLWLLERLADGKAQVLSSAMGEDWQVESRLAGGKPSEISIINGAIYVAGAGDDGRGILWGPKQHTIPKLVERPIVPEQFLGSPEKGDVWDMAQDFDAILSDIQNYRDHGRGPIRDILFAALELGTPNGFYAGRLKAVLKEGTVSAFGGQLEISARGLGRNILLWGMGLAKQDDVPLEDLRAPWVKKSNTFEKYIDAQPIAIWAAANAHQNDRPTIDEFVKRLDAKDDPLWLRSQIIGALTRLTGQHFAYDVDAWQNWWNSARMKWQK